MANTTENTKVTKRQYFAELVAILEGAERTTITNEELVAFINHEVELIDQKNEKAAARRAAKVKEADELQGRVQEVLTEELQTAGEIVAAIGDVEVTNAKVVARMKKLIEAGVAVKKEVKREGHSKKVVAYRLA